MLEPGSPAFDNVKPPIGLSILNPGVFLCSWIFFNFTSRSAKFVIVNFFTTFTPGNNVPKFIAL